MTLGAAWTCTKCQIKCEQWTTDEALCALPSNVSVGNVGTCYCCRCTARCNASFDFDKIGCPHCKSRNSYEEGQRDAGWAGLRLAALCIGVGAYSGSSSLDNPVRDAEALSEAINKCPDCRAATVRDPDSSITILEHLKDDFLKELAALPVDELPDVVMVVAAGHGMQHDSNVFLVPAKAKCDDKMDLEGKCLSHTRVLQYLREILDKRARDACPPKEVKFVLIMDMCRNPGAFDLTGTISEPDRSEAPGCWCICYSTSRGSLAADGAPGSNSPLVLGLMDPHSGIFAPGVSLAQGIINACESLGKLSGVDMRQCPIKVNIDCLGNVILQARPLSQEVREVAGSADTATSQYEVVAYLKLKGLARIAERLSEELGLEKIQHLQHVDEEQIGKLDWLKPLQRKVLLEICREVVANHPDDDRPSPTAIRPPYERCGVSAKNGGDSNDFQENIAAKIGCNVEGTQSKGGYDDMEDTGVDTTGFDDKRRAVDFQSCSHQPFNFMYVEYIQEARTAMSSYGS